MTLRRILLAAALTTVLPTTLSAQDTLGEQVSAALRSRSDARERDVHDLTLHLTTQGVEMVIHARHRDKVGGGFDVGWSFGKEGFEAEYLGEWSVIADDMLTLEISIDHPGARVSRDGMVSTVDGPQYAVTVRPPAGTPETSEFTLDHLTLQVDTGSMDTRHVIALGRTASGAEATIDVEYGDWRSVSGTQIPFRRRIIFRGYRDIFFPPGMLDARVERLHALTALTPAQRAELQLLQALQRKDEIVVDERVTSAALNQGPPQSMTFTVSHF